jgi:hypothetical protein
VLPKGEDVMGLLGCYLDDSKDGSGKVVIAVAGFWGWAPDFIDTENKWNDCLRRHGLAYFKANECENLHGEFFKYRRRTLLRWEDKLAAAANIRSELIAILNASRIDGIGLGMAIADFERVRSTEPGGGKVLRGGTFYFSYHSLMIDLVKRIEKDFRSHIVAFVCDEHSDWKAAEEAYADLNRKNPRSAQKMGSITHADDKVCVPLQMADLMAYETRRAREAVMKGTNPNDRNALTELAPSVLFFGNVTEEYLREVVRDLRDRTNGGDENE